MTAPEAPRIVGRIGRMKVRNGRYFDGHESYQRMSNTLKEIETDTFNLDEWKANMLAIGMSQRPDLVLGVSAATVYDERGKLTKEAKDTLRGLRKQATDAARSKAGMNQGNALHTATERLDMGETVEQIGLPYPFNADLQAYWVLRRAMGLSYRPEHIERTVRLLDYGVAGTFDRLASSTLLVERGILAPDELIVTDVKTEEDPLLNLIHIAPQLGGYAGAAELFVPGDPTDWDDDDPNRVYYGTYEPMPKVSKTAGLVIHIRNGRATPYLVNLRRGWNGFRAAVEQRERIKSSKIRLGEPGAWAVPLQVDLPPATELTARAHARGPQGFSGPATGHQIGDTVTVGGIQFTKHSELPTQESTEAYLAGHIDQLDKSAIENVWAAGSVADLAETFRIYTEVCGRTWGGRVAEAATARRRQIECPQRQLHTNGGKCACGWVGGLAA